MFGGFVSPLKKRDATRDSEREAAKEFSISAQAYVNKVQLGELMAEMMTGLVLHKPEKPIGTF